MELPRRLGAWSAVGVLVGSTIGSGIFRLPSVAAADTRAAGTVMLLWIAGALITLAGVLTIAELATMFPRSGGLYVYLREAYGPLPAFLFGWTRVLLIQPTELGGIALIFAAYARAFVPVDETGVRLIAVAALVTVAALNYRSVRLGAVVQNASSAAKVIALFVLSAAVFVFGDGSRGALAGPLDVTPASWGGFGLALIAVMFAYDGWADVTYAGGEIANPGRNLPRALGFGVLIVCVVYLVVNAAFLYVLPLDEMAGSSLVAADAATRVFGSVGRSIVAALVMLSTFGALNGPMMTHPRIFYAMANDGLFFKRIGAVHPRFQTPHASIVLTAALGIAYVWSRTFEQLARANILGIWPFYALSVGAVFLLRRLPGAPQAPYRTIGYPIVPVLFLLASVAMIGNSLVRQPQLTLFGFGIILSGVPVYCVWKRMKGG